MFFCILPFQGWRLWVWAALYLQMHPNQFLYSHIYHMVVQNGEDASFHDLPQPNILQEGCTRKKNATVICHKREGVLVFWMSWWKPKAFCYERFDCGGHLEFRKLRSSNGQCPSAQGKISLGMCARYITAFVLKQVSFYEGSLSQSPLTKLLCPVWPLRAGAFLLPFLWVYEEGIALSELPYWDTLLDWRSRLCHHKYSPCTHIPPTSLSHYGICPNLTYLAVDSQRWGCAREFPWPDSQGSL